MFSLVCVVRSVPCVACCGILIVRWLLLVVCFNCVLRVVRLLVVVVRCWLIMSCCVVSELGVSFVVCRVMFVLCVIVVWCDVCGRVLLVLVVRACRFLIIWLFDCWLLVVGCRFCLLLRCLSCVVRVLCDV